MSKAAQRRRFIQSVIAAVGGAGLWPAAAAARSGNDRLMDKLAGLVDSRYSAVQVGRAYLRNAARSPEPDALLDGVLQRLGGREHVSRAGAGELKQSLARASRRDFAERDTVSVNGWLLSSTEVSLCAVLALDND